MALFFNSNDIQVFPTAHRSAKDSEGKLIKNSLTSRLNTEYNITNLVEGLLNQNINNGNFVIDCKNHIITFCMGGYYFKVTLDSSITNLWVKLNTKDFDYGRELVPDNYSSDRELDVLSGEDYVFKGLTYLTSDPTSDPENTDYYFQLLSNGTIPEKSKLRFSIDQIGYMVNDVWHAISSEFSTNTLTANNLSTTNLDTDNLTLNFDDIKSDGEALQIGSDGSVSLNDLSTNGETASGNYAVISKVSQNSIGKISVEQKTLPVSTNVEDSSDTQNINLITRYAVKTYVDTNKIDKTDLTFSYNNGTLTITKNY